MKEINGFIKNHKLLEETHKTEDLLDFTTLQKNLIHKLNNIKPPAILALVGGYGTGKSTLLNLIKEQSDKEAEIWIEFDAWKYPGRKNLWEGFILDFAEQIGRKKEAIRNIDGKDIKIPLINAGTDLFSFITDWLPHFEFIDRFAEIFKTSPATRVFELQKILEGLVNSQKDKKIFVICEDIDRAGEEGLFFLETLKQFISSATIKENIIIISPVSDNHYYNNIDTYIKCTDYIEFFNPTKTNLSTLVEKVFDSSIYERIVNLRTDLPNNSKTQIISFLDNLFISYPTIISIRKIKTILRKADINYINQIEDGHEPDWRISICFEAMKYIPSGNGNQMLFETVKSEKVISSGVSCCSLLYAILRNTNTIYDGNNEEEKQILKVPESIHLTKREGSNSTESYPSIPYFAGNSFDNSRPIYIADFYLDY